jgi:hypothetical protein
MFANQVWVHSEKDPIGEFITTNECWDVDGLDTRLIKESTFQTLKI